MPYANIKSYHVIPKVFFWLSRSFPPYLYFLGGRRNTAPRSFTCLFGPKVLGFFTAGIDLHHDPKWSLRICRLPGFIHRPRQLFTVNGPWWSPKRAQLLVEKGAESGEIHKSLLLMVQKSANHLIWILYLSIYRVFHIPGGVNLVARNQ